MRRQVGPGGLSVWLLKAAVRHASRRGNRARNSRDPDVWRSAWERREWANWPAAPVTGIVEAADIKLVLDRCEITDAGYLWLDGWALKPDTETLDLQAEDCTVEWQSVFATARPDVVQALQLSMLGRDAKPGFQILARIKGYVPGRSRLALTTGSGGAAARLVVPVVPQVERSGSLWHAVYDAMRHRGPRDAAYLETSVALLKDLRKADWRERNAAICRSIDAGLPEDTRLKILVLSRLNPGVAYLNMQMLAAARPQSAAFIVCSMGQAAIQRANEYRTELATVGAHDVTFVSAEFATPSSELIEHFWRACQRRGCAGLVVYDDVAVVSAMGSLGAALRQDKTPAIAWRRNFPLASTPADFTEPLAANGGPGPYWRSSTVMEHGGLGALLLDPAGVDIPAIPPFEGRGQGLEYLLKTALADADVSDETMLDLLDPAGQREAHGLDMLMLLASEADAA